jgi:hypothetical protein
MNQEVDPFVPIKGKHCPYGGWCRTCMSKIPISGNFFNDYPGICRAYHGGPNYCKTHEADRAIHKAEEDEMHRMYLESINHK